MKRFILFFILPLALGCTDILDQEPLNAPTADDFFKTEADAILSLNAAYAALTKNDTEIYGQIMVGTELLSDNAWTGSTVGDGPYGRWTGLFYTTEDSGIRQLYTNLYQAIARANAVINRVPEIEFDNARKNQIIGEARFLRAYEYFLLTLFYGEVPIVLETAENPAGAFSTKSSAAEVYDRVITDLTEAESTLSEDPLNGEIGRVIKSTATAMLAKVYLFAADELSNNAYYAQALSKAEEVINLGKYDLFDTDNPEEDFKSIFSLENQNGKEHIFSIQHQSAGRWGQPNSTRLIMALNPRQSRQLIWGFGHTYIHDVVGDPGYWEAGDARRDVTLWENGESPNLSTHPSSNPDLVFDMASQARAVIRPHGYGLQKFYWQEPDLINAGSALNWPVLRYADLLLIHAEASLMANGSLSGMALSSYNAVRNRAGLADKTTATREDILKERQLEFIGEFQRWFDLMRTRTAEQAFAKLTSSDKIAFNASRHYKFPLPQAALEVNQELIQNPAWSGEN